MSHESYNKPYFKIKKQVQNTTEINKKQVINKQEKINKKALITYA